MVNNDGRVLSIYYKKEKVEFWDADLDKYSMIDLYRGAKSSFEKLGLNY